MAIPFVDLKRQYAALKARIDANVHAVLDHGQYIGGPEVARLEEKLAAFAGARRCITCASGTDALQVLMMAEGVGRGDAVFVPSFTYTATAETILLLGATPVFVEVNARDFNIDTAHLEASIAGARSAGRLRPRAIVAVDLFGLPADYAALNRIAEREGLYLIADAAQSFGAEQGGSRVGALAPATATSFFPAKPLGCYGDGGAIFVEDAERAAQIRSICLHGKGSDKYDVVRLGVNSRLDTIQAAVLLAKLEIFPDEIARRNRIARLYDEALRGTVETPPLPNDATSVWAQYTVKLDRRDEIQARLHSQGIPTSIYYPRPMHLQPAYCAFGGGEGSLPVSEELSARVLSLPMHGHMEEDEAIRVAEALRKAVGGG